MAGERIVFAGAVHEAVPAQLLGAGGTLARHVLAGDEVHAIVVADGAGSRYPAELVSTLEKQAHRAADVIGFASLQFLSFPDQRLDTVPLIELTQHLGFELEVMQAPYPAAHAWSDYRACSRRSPSRHMLLTALTRSVRSAVHAAA